jgi:hypothetical protein
MSIKKIINISAVLWALFFMAGCAKDTTYTILPQPVAVVNTVYFSKDLLPIITKSCAVSSCHASGGQKPDLSTDNAYNALINGKYIDLGTPTNSIIYERLTGKLSPSMPMGQATNPSNINNLMLAWIKQGAKKN